MRKAFFASRVFDGTRFRNEAALLVRNGRIEALVGSSEVPGDIERQNFPSTVLAPGFVDWHVNGGGGVLFNHDRSLEGLQKIAWSHGAFGTTSLVPTLITDHPSILDEGADAVASAIAGGVAGIVGIHFEGPNLSRDKCGVHDPNLMHPLDRSDRARVLRNDIGVVVATIAPEVNGPGTIRDLAGGGVRVSLGHSNATYDQAMEAFDDGATGVTHIYNAMSGLHHRAPGLVGAALQNKDVVVGIIADGHHVHPAALTPFMTSASINRCSLVTDAMSTIGSDIKGFELNGRIVRRQGDRLTLADGTLAGSHLDMASAVRLAVTCCGATLSDALRMASLIPSRYLGLSDRGHFRVGARADIVVLDENLRPTATFISGEPAHGIPADLSR